MQAFKPIDPGRLRQRLDFVMGNFNRLQRLGPVVQRDAARSRLMVSPICDDPCLNACPSTRPSVRRRHTLKHVSQQKVSPLATGVMVWEALMLFLLFVNLITIPICLGWKVIACVDAPRFAWPVACLVRVCRPACTPLDCLDSSSSMLRDTLPTDAYRHAFTHACTHSHIIGDRRVPRVVESSD